MKNNICWNVLKSESERNRRQMENMFMHVEFVEPQRTGWDVHQMEIH